MIKVPEITDEEMNSLTQSILVRYGIDFTCYEPKSLKRRIIRVMTLMDFPSVFELWQKFLRDKNFLQDFMNQISVGMTSMFRDPILWKTLRERIANEYQGKDSLSIWHAGCSTGEEVYSLSILLQELELRCKAKVLATDFNSDAIQEAKSGIYHKIKMLENESNYKEFNPQTDFKKYYHTDGKYSVMNPELIAKTEFSNHNLITDKYNKGFDMIFCRNVMIYFDNNAKTKIINRFYESLNPGGLFVIGFFDTMSHLISDKHFKMIDENAKIFRKMN